MGTENGLLRTTLPQSSRADSLAYITSGYTDSIESCQLFSSVKERIESYFSGDLVDFTNEIIDIHDVTGFVRKAWLACMSIPYGETRTYKWLAQQSGNPLAARAAGQAMARNRLPVIVPCHRVIASDGRLHGFGGGKMRLGLKHQMLVLEGYGFA